MHWSTQVNCKWLKITNRVCGTCLFMSIYPPRNRVDTHNGHKCHIPLSDVLQCLHTGVMLHTKILSGVHGHEKLIIYLINTKHNAKSHPVAPCCTLIKRYRLLFCSYKITTQKQLTQDQWRDFNSGSWMQHEILFYAI